MRPDSVVDPPVLQFRVDEYQGGARHRPHTHEELHFSMVLRGRIAESVGGATEHASSLSLVAKDAGVRHANEFGPQGAQLARLSLRDGTIGQLIDDPRRIPGWRWTHDPRIARPFLRLVRRVSNGSGSFHAADPDVVDLLALFTARPAPCTGTPPVWLQQVMQELREGWCPAVNVAALARRAGVHPVYLARCARRWYGTGLAEELRRQRVRVVAERITSTVSTISDVAHAAGYADEPHLNREFRLVTGLPPGRFRTTISGQSVRRRDD